MCGIAGFYLKNHKPASAVALKAMTDIILHRGPDGEGQWIEGSVGLGHRRLAILDLSAAGHQPMITRDGRYVLTFNGEVYNYKELRTELESLGYQFHSQTDTEVVLYSLVHWGVDGINKFNGMFAFAFYDRSEKVLLLARDRYGIKPLYYAQNHNGLIFSSEVKAIIASNYYKASINHSGILEYFTFQNFLTNSTLFKDIKILEAGTYAIYKESLQELKKYQYWDFNFETTGNDNDRAEDIEDKLDFLFQQAVSRQLVSDVDIGSYLSGGMDSGSITAVAAKQLPYIKTFTCGFDLNSASGIELSFDERHIAEYMSYVFKTEHYEMVLKAGDMERCMKKLVWHLEEPRVGQSYPNFYISQLASKFVKVILSGTGGDEIFAGYPWRYYFSKDVSDFGEYIDNYYLYWQRLLPNKILKNLISPIAAEVDNVWTKEIFSEVFKESKLCSISSVEDYINQSLYFESKTFLHGLLVVEDKLSMSHSLEARVPFLDNDLVDYAQKIPLKYKLLNLEKESRIDENESGSKTVKYFQKTKDGKIILREMMKRHLPQKVIEREKQGFSAPDASWFKGESINYVKDLIGSPKARIYDYFDYNVSQSLLNEHFTGQVNRRLLIWSLVYFENFLNVFEL